MVAENTQTQMRKGILEYCILAIISRGEIYASDIISELKNAKLTVVEGTVYPLLTRLKNNSLLTYKWVESVSGPPRKYFELSPDGEAVLSELHNTWKELAFAVGIATHSHTRNQSEVPLSHVAPASIDLSKRESGDHTTPPANPLSEDLTANL